MSAIKFIGATKSYGKRIALRDVSYEVPRGVVFALLGDNGAGKTTSINAMLGMLPLDKGSIEVLGWNAQQDDLHIRRRVGYVPEQPQLYDWMTVDEAGWFVAGFHSSEFLTQYRRHIDDFGIACGQKISALSKGMKAKVSLALALSSAPELLILDEPTSGLDPIVRREFLESMVELAADGKTVFLSSHQIHEVERVADYVAVMRAGEVLVVDKMEDLKDSICELQVTVTDPGVPAPLEDEYVLSSQRRGRQWRLLTRELPETELESVHGNEFVCEVEVRRPSLEEILVGYLGNADEYSEREAV